MPGRIRLVLLAFLVGALAACAGKQQPTTVVQAPVVERSSSPVLVLSEPDPIVIPVSRADIQQQMLAIIGDSTAAAVTSEATSFDISSDLDILSFASHDRVVFFVDAFTNGSRERTRSFLSRGTRYEPMIRSKLRAASLPEDLYYLAFIESGFALDAYSSAAAVGMWQFMTATAKGEGLKVDWWVDERRDPVLATDAAVRHLSWLRKQFGSLFLSAAAYNGGSGLVSRGLARHSDAVARVNGEEAFFALAETNYLREETRDYVPKLIAAALVAKSAASYEMRFDTLPAFAYDSVLVEAATPLAAVAKAAGAPLAEIAELNNHVLRGVTHPREPMWLKVPPGAAEGFRAAFRALPAADLVPYSRTTSRAGETFATVARRLGMTSKQLSWYNPRDGASRAVLRTGSTILVPSAALLAAAKDVPDPAAEYYGGSGSRHVVKSGDTLSGLAKRYRTTVANIRRLNGLSGNTIRIGQTLRVR